MVRTMTCANHQHVTHCCIEFFFFTFVLMILLVNFGEGTPRVVENSVTADFTLSGPVASAECVLDSGSQKLDCECCMHCVVTVLT